MSTIRNSSSRKNGRFQSGISSISMTKSTQSTYSSSLRKQPKPYQSKSSISNILGSQTDYSYSQKSTLKEPRLTLKSYDRIDSLKDSPLLPDYENKKLTTNDKSNFRIRNSTKEYTPARNTEQQQRVREMEESLKRRDRERQQREREQLSRIKLWEKQSALRRLDSQSTVDRTMDKKVSKDDMSPKTLGLVGLQNIGNTCFMNSILQCVFNLPEFNEYFLKDQHLGEMKRLAKVASAYGRMIKLMRSSSCRSENPSELKSAIGEKKTRFMGYSQQDAQQFLAGLLELLSLELNRSTNPKYRQLKADMSKNTLQQIQSEEWWKYNKERQDSVVSDYFTGQILSRVVCSKCKHESIAFDNTWDYALNFSNEDADVLKMFRNFLREETISDDYYCAKCKDFKPCKRKLDFYRLPKVLVCQIKRFSYGRWRKTKLNNRVRVDSELDLSSLITDSTHSSVNNPIYELVGVVNHSGDIDFGHYTAECMNPINRKWYNFNDSSVHQISKKTSFDSSSPYLLFYFKKD